MILLIVSESVNRGNFFVLLEFWVDVEDVILKSYLVICYVIV